MCTEQYNLKLELKFDNIRQYYLRLHQNELHDRPLPEEFINVVKKRDLIECSTLKLVKLNQKANTTHRFHHSTD